MKRFLSDAWVLVGLVVVFAVLTYILVGRIPEEPETRPHRTTISAKPGGLKAAYLLLERQKIGVGRNYEAPKRWPKDARVMITATPYKSGLTTHFWSDDEIKDTLRWVESGNTLIILDSERDDLLEKLKLSVETHLKRDKELAPQQPAAFLAGVKTVKFPDNERFLKIPPSAVPLFGDLKPAMVALSQGKGRIYAVATPGVIENATIAEADNARFFVQLIRHSLVPRTPGQKTGRVYFNEFHQGQDADRRSVWTMIGKPGQFAFYQLVALAVLMAYSFSRRFGLPRPVPSPPRVSSEYVSSLADLYRRARAADAALEGVYLAFWRDLCRAVGLPLDSSTSEVVRHAAGLVEDDTKKAVIERLTRVLDECEARIDAGEKPLRDPELLRLTRDLEALRKDLQLGADDR